MDLSAFGNPWEHIRLLSDARRNAQMIEVLRRRAPGARVVEVGCGTGLLSCVAARLGARKVYAVEPTEVVEQARWMVKENGLSDVVEVIEGMIEDVPRQEVDFAFSELLNADPFEEGVMQAMKAVRPWVAAGGFSSPTRLRVYTALARATGSAAESRRALEEVRAMAATYDLYVSALEEAFSRAGTYRYHSDREEPVSDPALVWDLEVGVDDAPEEARIVELVVRQAGPAAGAMVWFAADLDEGVTLDNAPGFGGHWGQLVCGWPDEEGFRYGQRVRLRVTPGDDGVNVELV